MSVHLTPEELRAFVQETLDSLDQEHARLDHLSQCDECFQLYEGLWAEASGELPDLANVFPDSTVSQRLELRLLNRIHAAGLGTASSWLATEGLLRVVLGVLLPLISFDHAPTSRDKGEKP